LYRALLEKRPIILRSLLIVAIPYTENENLRRVTRVNEMSTGEMAHVDDYVVALVSWIDKIIGLFCKRALYKRQYFVKETYNLIDSTERSPPICDTLICECDENMRNGTRVNEMIT